MGNQVMAGMKGTSAKGHHWAGPHRLGYGLFHLVLQVLRRLFCGSCTISNGNRRLPPPPLSPMPAEPGGQEARSSILSLDWCLRGATLLHVAQRQCPPWATST